MCPVMLILLLPLSSPATTKIIGDPPKGQFNYELDMGEKMFYITPHLTQNSVSKFNLSLGHSVPEKGFALDQ